MGYEEVLGKIIEYSSSDPAMYSLIAMLILASVGLNVKGHYDIKGLKEKLRKYEEEFGRFELTIEPLLSKHKLPKEIEKTLRSFLVESKLIWSGKK